MNLKRSVSLFALAAVSLSAVACSTSVDELNVPLMPENELSSFASGAKSGDVIPGEFIVKYKKTAKNASSTVLNSIGAKRLKDLNSGAQLIKLNDVSKNAAAMTNLAKDPNIEWVEANRVMALPKIIRDILDRLTGKDGDDVFPNDPKFSEQYAHKVSQSVDGWKLAKANSKKQSVIAIIDTGIDGTHPDLKAKLIQPGYDAYGQGKEYSDKQGHGTHCAGIASAITNNGVGVAGYSPDSKLIAVKALQDSGSGTYAAVADAIAWAAKNEAVDVLSMSLGGPSSSQAIQDAVNLALEKGKIVVAAMGNDGNEKPSYPAAIKGVVAVGATDSNDKIASFSQFGQHISVSAPGVNIMSTFPTYQSGMPGKDYGKISGTSMACPGVSGLAGLLKSVNPSLNGKQLRDIIEKTADDLGAAGFDKYYGHGRINTLKAVEKVVGNSAR